MRRNFWLYGKQRARYGSVKATFANSWKLLLSCLMSVANSRIEVGTCMLVSRVLRFVELVKNRKHVCQVNESTSALGWLEQEL